MKLLKLVSVIVAIAILAACSQQATPTNIEIPEGDISSQASSWQKLGGVIDATIDKSPMEVVMLLDRTEKPVVASLEDDNKGNYKMYFQTWTGTTWQSFAPSLVVSRSGYPSFDFQVDLNNRPVVFAKPASASQYGVYRYENGAWKRLGNPSDSGGNLTIANNGNIYTLVSDYTKNKSFIRRWNGSSWQTDYTFQKITTTDYLGNPLSGGPIAHAASSLKFTKTNKPVVTWGLTSDEWGFASSPPTQVEVWNGSVWQDGGEFQQTGILDKNDNIVSASIPYQYSSALGCTGMDVSQNNKNLKEIPDVSVNSGFSLAVDTSNHPVVAHTIRCVRGADSSKDKEDVQAKRDLVVRRWSGSSWQTVGGVVDRIANQGAESEAMAIDSKNTIYVLFRQCATFNAQGNCTNNNLYLSKYVP